MNTPATRTIKELVVDECLELLTSQSLGRLVYLDDGKPQIRPLTYGVHQGSVVFRIGYGGLLDLIHLQPVIFEIDHGDADTRTGWSVIVHGIAEEIWRSDELNVVREMGLQPWAPGERDHYVRILPTSITGRRIN